MRFALCLAAAIALPAAAVTPAPPAKVMLVGMFHFANPGQDLVKGRVIDVTTAENQAWLDAFAARLAAFRPTDVLVECSPKDQGDYDAQFRAYVAGDFALPANENHQVGFRVAKAAGLDGITCFDEDNIGWDAGPMFEYIEKNDPETKQAIEALFATLSADTEREQSTLSLPRLLQLANDPGRDAFNKGLYLRTNEVDAGGGFAGADAAASWWHRNFRMYANIQKAAAPGHRVIALGGQGHTAILRDLLAVDGRREAEAVAGYLRE
jgi:hypothetical protein